MSVEAGSVHEGEGRSGLVAGDREEERGYQEGRAGERYAPPSDSLLEAMYKKGRDRGERESLGGLADVYEKVAEEQATNELIEAARDVVHKAGTGGYGTDGLSCPFVARLNETLTPFTDRATV